MYITLLERPAPGYLSCAAFFLSPEIIAKTCTAKPSGGGGFSAGGAALGRYANQLPGKRCCRSVNLLSYVRVRGRREFTGVALEVDGASETVPWLLMALL
jgi:hypothetical protein